MTHDDATSRHLEPLSAHPSASDGLLSPVVNLRLVYLWPSEALDAAAQ